MPGEPPARREHAVRVPPGNPAAGNATAVSWRAHLLLTSVRRHRIKYTSAAPNRATQVRTAIAFAMIPRRFIVRSAVGGDVACGDVPSSRLVSARCCEPRDYPVPTSPNAVGNTDPRLRMLLQVNCRSTLTSGRLARRNKRCRLMSVAHVGLLCDFLSTRDRRGSAGR